LQIQKRWPGHVVIGDDRGCRFIAVALNGSGIWLADGWDAASPRHVAADFRDWLEAGCPLPASQRLVAPSVVSAALDAALREYQNAGGVIDYVPFVLAHGRPSLASHCEAATLAMKQLLLDRFLERSSSPTPPTPVDVKQFVGPYYDWQLQSLLDPWQRTSSGGGSRGSNVVTDFITFGYADAFSDPPYSLQCPREHASTVFRTINRELFGALDDDLTIFSWPTDWSAYFEAGHEWWGAFYWTVFSQATSRLVVVAASTTD
jgi:hypothetical protein